MGEHKQQSEARCRHENCGCAPAPEHERYCSRYCAAAAQTETLSGACSCGHEICVESMRRETRGDKAPQAAVGPEQGEPR